MAKTMCSIVVKKFGGPEVLQYTVKSPMPHLESNQILIRLRNAGINPVETYIRSGEFGRLPDLPYIPGSDGAGVVEEIGKDVRGIKLGDRVFCTLPGSSGTYASYCTADSNSVWPLPQSLTFEQGAALGIPYFTAYRALFLKCQLKAGDRVLVHGASGAVGQAAVQLATAHDLQVYGTAGTDEGLRLVESNGAVRVFNHRQRNYLQQLKKAVPDGFDGIVEMLANVNLNTDLDLLANDGKVCVVGSRGSVTIDPRFMMAKESTIVGCALMSSTHSEWREMGNSVGADIERASVKPNVYRVFPLKQAAEAHVQIIENVGAMGKIVLAID